MRRRSGPTLTAGVRREIIRRVAPELDFTEALVAFDSALEAETAAGCKAMPGAADCLAAMARSGGPSSPPGAAIM
jgi:hypothetical protein